MNERSRRRTAPTPASPRANDARPLGILVPTDFSGVSAEALECAHDLARGGSADIDLLHVRNTPDAPAAMQRESFFADSAAGIEMERSLSIARAKHVRVRGRIESGDSLTNVLKLASSGAYDFIVMGVHGRAQPPMILDERFAQQVADRSGLPVVVVRTPRGPSATSESAGAVQAPWSSHRAVAT